MKKILCVLGIIAASSSVIAQEPMHTCKVKPPILEYDFSEGSGNILHDKSGNGNDGIIHGAEWIKNADGSYCLSFNGIDNQIEVKYSPSLSLGEEFTVEISVNSGVNEPLKGMGDFRLLLGQDGEFWSPTSSFGIYVTAGSGNKKSYLNAYYRYGATATQELNEVVSVASRGRIINTGKWENVIFVKDSKTLRLYTALADEEKDTPSAVMEIQAAERSIIRSEKPFLIGGCPSRYFKGLIKSVRIYNYPATPLENRVNTKSTDRKKPYC